MAFWPWRTQKYGVKACIPSEHAWRLMTVLMMQDKIETIIMSLAKAGADQQTVATCMCLLLSCSPDKVLHCRRFDANKVADDRAANELSALRHDGLLGPAINGNFALPSRQASFGQDNPTVSAMPSPLNMSPLHLHGGLI